MKNKKCFASLALAAVIGLSALAGCGGESANKEKESLAGTTQQGAQDTGTKDLPWIEFSYVARDPDSAQRAQIKPAGDVVTPYLENRFHIRLKEVVQGPKDSTIEQNVAMWAAANSMPDIVETDLRGASSIISSGKFADLTPYIKKNMPNYMETCWPEQYWDRTNVDGKQYTVMSFDAMKNPPIDAATDPYDEGIYAHGLFVREDILGQLGYKFTPIDELKAQTTDKGIKPTAEQLKIEPAIDSPEALYTLMKKIKDAKIKAPNGQEVIPMTLQSWMTHHLGCIFDFGRWRVDDKGDADGMLGTAGAKDYMQWLNKVYNEGLLDRDYILQQANQYQEKIGSGTAAIGFFAGIDLKAAEQSLAKLVPEARLRFIPWPKQDPNLGFYDVTAPEGYWNLLISADMKPEYIDRMTQFWDFMFSPEGQDIVAWGPEEGGLWEMKDGVKKFKDPQVENDCLNSVRNGKGADYYGLSERNISAREQNFSPLVLTCPGTINYKSFFRSYPAKLDFDNVTRNMLGSNGVNKDGRAANGDNSALVSGVENYYWSEFMSKDVAKILQAKPGSDFEKAWNEVYNSFVQKTDYTKAKAAMVEYFKKFPPMK